MLRDFFALLFPEPCPGCGEALLKNEPVICAGCTVNLPVFPFNGLEDNPLERRLWGRLPVDKAYAYMKFRKRNIVQKLLFAMKYDGNKDLCLHCGRAFGTHILKQSAGKYDAIVPVPLHSSKLKSRGYNQADVIASGISQILQIPVLSEALEKIASGVSQTRKRREERYENIKKVYRIRDAKQVEGKKLLLLDDVITTGATFEVCGSLLLEAGARSVSIAALAAAD